MNFITWFHYDYNIKVFKAETFTLEVATTNAMKMFTSATTSMGAATKLTALYTHFPSLGFIYYLREPGAAPL